MTGTRTEAAAAAGVAGAHAAFDARNRNVAVPNISTCLGKGDERLYMHTHTPLKGTTIPTCFESLAAKERMMDRWSMMRVYTTFQKLTRTRSSTARKTHRNPRPTNKFATETAARITPISLTIIAEERLSVMKPKNQATK